MGEEPVCLSLAGDTYVHTNPQTNKEEHNPIAMSQILLKLLS